MERASSGKVVWAEPVLPKLSSGPHLLSGAARAAFHLSRIGGAARALQRGIQSRRAVGGDTHTNSGQGIQPPRAPWPGNRAPRSPERPAATGQVKKGRTRDMSDSVEFHKTGTTGLVQDTDPRALISPALRDLIAADVVKKQPHLSAEQADQGVGQMAAFLAACAASDAPVSPSPLVDDFWHAFILRTRAYASWCEETFGTFIHHQPGQPTAVPDGKTPVARALDTIGSLGFLVDLDFWPTAALADCATPDPGPCSQCHDGSSSFTPA